LARKIRLEAPIRKWSEASERSFSRIRSFCAVEKARQSTKIREGIIDFQNFKKFKVKLRHEASNLIEMRRPDF